MRRIIHRIEGVDVPMGMLPNGMQVLLSPHVVHSDLSLQGVEHVEAARARVIYLQSTVPVASLMHEALEDVTTMLGQAMAMLTQSEL